MDLYRLTVNKSVECSHAQLETAANYCDVGLQVIMSTIKTVRKQVHSIES